MYSVADINHARSILGVTEEASPADIRKAYRKIALETHPDKNSAEDATSRMQEVNHACEVLIESENGKNLSPTIEPEDENKESSEDRKQREELEKMFKFYKAFFEKKQPGSGDVISEEKFQAVLRETKNRMEEYPGWVYPGYEALFGISATQIERLLAHCSEYGGNRFSFDGHAMRPEVLVALLHYLSDYSLPDGQRCKLDLSDNLFNHPEVIEALKHFLGNAKSQWALTLNKCQLSLPLDLAEYFANSKAIYSLSIQGNFLNEKDALGLKRILEENVWLEEIDISKNWFDHGTQVYIAEGIAASRSLTKCSLNLKYDSMSPLLNILDENVPRKVLSTCLKNPFKLESISLSGVGDEKLLLKLPGLLDVVNTRIMNLTINGLAIDPTSIQDFLTNSVPNLKELVFYECELTDDLLISIAEVINTLPALKDLWIHAPLGLHAGQVALLNAMRTNSTLEKLSFPYWNFIGFDRELDYKLPKKEVAIALTMLFKHNKTLKELNIEACNDFSPASAMKIAKSCEKFNRSLTKVKMYHGMMSQEAESIISHQVHANHKALNPNPSEPISRRQKEEKEEKEAEEKNVNAAYSTEEFNAILNEIRELISNQSSTLKLKELPSKESSFFHTESRLGHGSDDHISANQMEQIMDLALTGNFTHIDFSHESYLPPALFGIMLKKIRAQYCHNGCNARGVPLLGLNLSFNDLSGQLDELVALINTKGSRLTALNLANIDCNSAELVALAKAIQTHPALSKLSISGCSAIETGYGSRKYRHGDPEGSAALASMTRNSTTLKHLEITCKGLKNNELSNILASLEICHHPTVEEKEEALSRPHFFTRLRKSSGISKAMPDIETELPFNTTIESLSLEIDNENADDQLEKVLLTNSSIKMLKMYNRHNSFSGYSNSVRTAFGSPWLHELEIQRYRLGNTLGDENPVTIDPDTQLSSVCLKNCSADQQTLRLLKNLPLKVLKLPANSLYADTAGKELLELIYAKRNTLVELDLSINPLGKNEDKTTHGENSLFLDQLGEILKHCDQIRKLNLYHPNEYHLHDSVKFIRRLKINNSSIETFKFHFKNSFYGKGPYLDYAVSFYLEFISTEMQFKNTLLAKNEIDEAEWKKLEKLYENQIKNLLKRIDDRIDDIVNGEKFMGIHLDKPDPESVKWNAELNALLELLKSGDYAGFHTGWKSWKQVNGDTEDKIHIHLSLLLDMLDECLLFYANSIRDFNHPGHEWACAYPTETIILPGYETKLDIMEGRRIEEQEAREKQWAEERAAEEEKRQAEKEILEQAIQNEMNNTNSCQGKEKKSHFHKLFKRYKERREDEEKSSHEKKNHQCRIM